METAENTPSAEKTPLKSAPDKVAITSAAIARPDWVDQPSRRVGDTYEKSVTTGPYTTRLECESKIPDILQSELDQFVESYLGRQWVGCARPSPEQYRRLIAAEWPETKEYSVGNMTQIHLLLKFDQKAKELVGEMN